MKPHVLSLVGLFVLISMLVHAADTNPAPRLTIELRDGSRVMGSSVEDRMKFHSALLGDLKLKVRDIRSVDCAGAATNAAKLTTSAGDVLTVSFAEQSLAVKTGFGKVELAPDTVRRLSVSTFDTAGARRPGLVARWSGEGDGSDAVGGNTATLTDISFAEGKAGRAFSFNGSSSAICIPASQALDLGAGDGFTVMAWIKPDSVEGLHPLFQWSDENPLNLWIGIRPSENGVLRGDITDEQGNHFVVSNPNTLVPGMFQHIAFTYEKASGLGTLYVNGVIVAQRQLGRKLTAKTKGDLWISPRDDRPGNWSTGRTFEGLMDEVALYARALSPAEVGEICAAENRGEPLEKPTPSPGWFERWMR